MNLSTLMRFRTFLTAIGCTIVILCCGEGIVRAEDVDCNMCHADIAQNKFVHPAVSMGCKTCHAGIAGAPEVPHKITTKFPRGLSDDQPDLCYGCHDKGKFAQKTVHAAVGMGCTGCHDPHASNNEKLLKTQPPDLCYTCHDKGKFTLATVHAALAMGCTSCHSPHSSKEERLLTTQVPDLCFNCHDKKEFSRKNIHPPVAGGLCLSCHSPHSTENFALLLKAPSILCLDCHEQVSKKPHAIVGFSTVGHPLGLPKKDKKGREKKEHPKVMDPIRKDKPFSCASCHNPHSSDYMRLFRYAAESQMQLCQLCHKM